MFIATERQTNKMFFQKPWLTDLLFIGLNTQSPEWAQVLKTSICRPQVFVHVDGVNKATRAQPLSTVLFFSFSPCRQSHFNYCLTLHISSFLTVLFIILFSSLFLAPRQDWESKDCQRKKLEGKPFPSSLGQNRTGFQKSPAFSSQTVPEQIARENKHLSPWPGSPSHNPPASAAWWMRSDMFPAPRNLWAIDFTSQLSKRKVRVINHKRYSLSVLSAANSATGCRCIFNFITHWIPI